MILATAIGWRAHAALTASAGIARVMAPLSRSFYAEAVGEMIWIGEDDALLHARAVRTPDARVPVAGAFVHVAFDRVTINGRSHPIRATVTQALESEGIKGEAGKIGIGAGAGAILGAILGGAKGALAGILIGGGGTIAATEGKDVELAQGTTLRVRLDSPLSLAR